MLAVSAAITEGDQHLGLPPTRQAQSVDYNVWAEHRRTHHAGAQSFLRGGQQQVLRRHGGTLHCHQIFGIAAALVLVLIHVAHISADQDDGGRFGEPRVGAGYIGFYRLRVVAIRRTILTQALAHGGCKGFFG